VEILRQLEKSHARLDHDRAGLEVEIVDIVDVLCLDDDGIGIVGAHGVVPHVGFARRSHLLAGLDGIFDERLDLVDAGRCMNSSDLVAGRVPRAVKGVVRGPGDAEWSTKKEEQDGEAHYALMTMDR
jgi:hypothetical protein